MAQVNQRDSGKFYDYGVMEQGCLKLHNNSVILSGRNQSAIMVETCMNERQRRFANLIFQGRPAGRAYEEAGYDARGKTADEAASRLSRNAKVKVYLSELRKETKSAAVMSGQEIRETLTRCIKAAEKAEKWRAVSSLSDRLAKLDQLYAPQQIENIDKREKIAHRVRLVGPLIASKIAAANHQMGGRSNRTGEERSPL